MTLSVGLGKIINDPDASVLTRKALGALSNPALIVYDDALTIDGTGRLVLKLKPEGGLEQSADGLSLITTVEIGVDSHVNVGDGGRSWNAQLTGNAPNFFEGKVVIGGAQSAPSQQLFVSSSGNQLRLGGDSASFLNVSVTPSQVVIDSSVADIDFVDGGVRFQTGARLWRMLVGSSAITINYDGTQQNHNITVTGALAGDYVVVTPHANPDVGLLSWNGGVISSNTVRLRVQTANTTGSEQITWRILVIRVT